MTQERPADRLMEKLEADKDERTQDYLILLRSLRDDFQNHTSQPGVQMRSARVREQVSAIFNAAVEQLGNSFKLWELSENLGGESRRKVLANRELILKEVSATIDRLQGSSSRLAVGSGAPCNGRMHRAQPLYGEFLHSQRTHSETMK